MIALTALLIMATAMDGGTMGITTITAVSLVETEVSDEKKKIATTKKINKKKGQYCTTTILIFSYRKADFFEIFIRAFVDEVQLRDHSIQRKYIQR